MTAAARGVVGVRVAEDDSMGSALADDAMAFKAACTMAADAYELLLLPLSPLPEHQSTHSVLDLQLYCLYVVCSQLSVHNDVSTISLSTAVALMCPEL